MPAPKRKTTTRAIDTRQRLQILIESGITDIEELENKTGASRMTIFRVKNRLKNGEGMERRQGSGRPPLLQTRDKQRILGFVRENPSWSREQVAVAAAARGSPRVSRWTVGRYLKSINWIKCLPQTKPMLTQEQKRKRLTWCLEHRNTDWSKVVFSDEASFQLFSNKTPLWMMKKKKKTKRMPKYSPKIHVWGAISFRGTSTLGIFGRNVNSEVYCDVLHENLPSIEELFPDGFQFQQDNAPPHVSHYTASWMSSNDVHPIKWPPGSPDLNPIENVWGLIKRKLGLEDPSKVAEWKDKINDLWVHLDFNYLESLIMSMPRRIEMCIARNGDTIPY
jgi:transposase